MNNEVKETQKAVSDMINKMGFEPSEFCELMGNDHRTLQQNFTRLCFAWIKHMANVEHFDLRNEASVFTCKEIVRKMDDYFHYLPSV